MMMIVENINNGQDINQIFVEFSAIRTKKQYDKLAVKACKARFGTYKNKTILDVIENFTITNSPAANEFIMFLKRALK